MMKDNQETDKKSTVRAVERSLDILICFIDEKELSLTDISNRITLHKSTAYRLLNTLQKKGFLIRNPENDKYRLGFRILELSSNLIGIDDPSTLFLPKMQRLRDTLDETVSLYVRDGLERIRIQAVESNQAIRRVAPIGARLPLSVGASSKVLVSFENPSTRENILDQLEHYYKIDRNNFIDIIKEVHIKGYATSYEEREIGVAAIASPIFNRNDEIIAALSVSGPLNRLTPKKLDDIAPILKETTIQLSKIL